AARRRTPGDMRAWGRRSGRSNEDIAQIHAKSSSPRHGRLHRRRGGVRAMIITRTPMRVSLGGGGTDLPSHYRVSGGFLVAAAISRHVYIAVNRNFDDDILLKYSHIEKVARVA